MEKLTLENTLPFVAYGLKVECNNVTNQKHYKNVVLQFTNSYTDVTVMTLLGSKWHKLILRPMDLTKPIQVDGKEIIPIVYLKKSGTDIFSINSWIHQGYGGLMSRCVDNEEHELKYSQRYGFEALYKGDLRSLNEKPLIKQLYEWKFDVDGLIEKGLAIDVNTLETNPYD